MSIPLDRLYHYLKNLCSEDILIYRYFPHGSKKISDIHILEAHPLAVRNPPYIEKMTIPHVICHDQEPLDYNFYSHQDCVNKLVQSASAVDYAYPWQQSSSFRDTLATTHLRTAVVYPLSFHDYIIICHSEKNSDQLALYQRNNFVGVYYWSHGLIARDWFRFAEHDASLNPNFQKIHKDFLIYNRAWTGTREYRLKFVELVLHNNLQDYCNVKFNPVDGYHYHQHKFKNPQLQISKFDFESYLPTNTTDSNASADYNSLDYQTSGIEVVLETLFDDSRQHLTEKILRPIACGRPFILASTPGSLEYLKDYGFKTFNEFIDESYDSIVDPLQRLQAIVAEMNRIAKLDAEEKTRLWKNLYEISAYNQQIFFSKGFHDQITNEFVDNLNNALRLCKENITGSWYYKATNPDVIGIPIEKIEGPNYFLANDWLSQHNSKS